MFVYRVQRVRKFSYFLYKQRWFAEQKKVAAAIFVVLDFFASIKICKFVRK